MKKINERDMLKISELAKAAGVSPSTIRYYVQEDLLTPPTRTSRNMAYYDPQCVPQIRQIQQLQSKRYLPLAAIKLLMQAEQQGQAPAHIVEMQSMMENIYKPLQPGTRPLKMDRTQLSETSGLTEPTLKELEALELISASKSETGGVYDDLDLRVAQIYSQLAAVGFYPSDLAIFRRYIALAREEAQALHNTFHRLPNHDSIRINELLGMIDELKRCLTLRTFRQEGRSFNRHPPGQEAH
jgi:DNA-binding transcriptional MerR regulator